MSKNESNVVTEIKEKEKEVKVSKIGKVINCSMLNVRAEPNIMAKVVKIINNEEKVIIIKSSKDFYYIKLNDNTVGYCMKNYIEEDKS